MGDAHISKRPRAVSGVGRIVWLKLNGRTLMLNMAISAWLRRGGGRRNRRRILIYGSVPVGSLSFDE